MANIQAPKGTHDILPSEIYKWQFVENLFYNICRRFGYYEIRLPVFEYTELFQRGVGDTTDIVQKEMYTFEDKGGRSITLRPEGTASVVRSYIENGMASLPPPVKLFYNISAYRYEKMAKGRYREFHQFGVEAFGSKEPQIDVEVISLVHHFLDTLGIKEVKLNLNSIGCPVCRKDYNEKLRVFLEPKVPHLCDTCKTRFVKNPLRIIDCKDNRCKAHVQAAPALLDNVCSECKTHFDCVCSGLDSLKIPYSIDKGIVRGLDYYTKTVFEFISEHVGTQGTVLGGGRYDGLVEECGGVTTPGVGFAMGVERLLMVIESQGITIPKPTPVEIYIANIGPETNDFVTNLVFKLRVLGIPAERDLLARSVKAQMKYADKIGAKYTIVIGSTEMESNECVLKNMKTGNQQNISLDNISQILLCENT